jgi:hypothetical protein
MIESHSAPTPSAKSRPQRGRPIGSGIDDAARLAEVRALLATNPGMKPTTAIRLLGHADPSIIRRLRDKLKAGSEAPRRTRAMAAAAGSSRGFRIVEDVPPKPTAKPSMRSALPAADPLIAIWLELTLSAVSMALTTQQAMMSLMLKNPLVRTMVQQHVAANEMALSLLRVPAFPSRRR